MNKNIDLEGIMENLEHWPHFKVERTWVIFFSANCLLVLFLLLANVAKEEYNELISAICYQIDNPTCCLMWTSGFFVANFITWGWTSLSTPLVITRRGLRPVLDENGQVVLLSVFVSSVRICLLILITIFFPLFQVSPQYCTMWLAMVTTD